MELRLTGREQQQLADTQTGLLSGLTCSSVDEWRGAVLRGLRQLVGAERGLLLMPSPGSRLAYSEDFTPAEVDEYEALFPADSGRAQVRAAGLEVWTHARLLRPNPDIFYKSWIYHDFYRPRRLEDGIGYVVESSDHASFGVLKLHHSRLGRRNFGERGRAILGLLLPAFKAGIRSWARAPLGTELTAVIDGMKEGVALYDGVGARLHRNPVLQELLQRDPQRAALEESLENVRRAVEGARGAGQTVAHAAGSTPYQRTVVTVGGRYEIWGTFTPGTSPTAPSMVIVFVRPSGIMGAAVARAAARLGLTRRETQVLEHLVRGASTKQVAHVLHISVNTARRHTEAVMRKSNVHSRSALSDVILSVSASGTRD
jgi:DNA-binding CsgD family transcriptional regulator